MKKNNALWRVVAIACVVEAFFRLIGRHASGSILGMVIFLFHFPAIIITSLLLRDPESPLWLWIEIGTSIVFFTLYIWGGIRLWRWYEKRRNA